MTTPDRPRPRDWAPLSATDPLPGNPAKIAAEAKRLKDMGVELRAQITALRQIGNASTLVGQYAEKLQTAATELAGKLEKTVGRYEQVSGHLDKWGTELAGFQATTLVALAKAKAAEEIRTKNAALIPVGAPIAVLPTLEEAAAARAAQCALDDADCMLRQARDQMQTAVEDARRRGREIARLIDDATDDDVKDGRWDRFKGWVDRNKGWIKVAVKGLSYVATAVAIVAIFIPGVNLIAAAAIGLTVLVMAGHSVLAASGNGSWFDVGLDAFALATFGAGRFLSAGIRSTSASTRLAATTHARRTAIQASLRANNVTRQTAQQTLATPGASTAMRRGARTALERTTDQAARAGTRAAAEARHVPAATRLEAIRAAGWQEARQIKHTKQLLQGFPGVQSVQQAGHNIDRFARAGEAAWISGVTVDVADKVAEDFLEAPRYEQLKELDAFRCEVGSTW